MKNKSEHLPVIIGIFMLFVVFLVSGGLVFSFLQSDTVQQHSEDSIQENNQLEEESEEDITVAPMPTENPGSGSAGIDTASPTGIPTGTYSNPPTTINSFESSSKSSGLSQESYGMNSLGSSVERNQLIQDSISREILDYSSPSSSNNFNQTNNQSLIKPLDNESLLNTSDDSKETTTGVTITQPLNELP